MSVIQKTRTSSNNNNDIPTLETATAYRTKHGPRRNKNGAPANGAIKCNGATSIRATRNMGLNHMQTRVTREEITARNSKIPLFKLNTNQGKRNNGMHGQMQSIAPTENNNTTLQRRQTTHKHTNTHTRTHKYTHTHKASKAKGRQASKQACKQASKTASNKQANKQTNNKQTNKHANKQTNQTNKQPSKQTPKQSETDKERQ